MGSALSLIALAGGAALLLAGSKAKAAGGGGGGSAVLPVNRNPKYDRNLPAILESTVDQELQNDPDPDSLRRFADSLDAQGYPIAAAALRKRASDLEQPVPPPAPNFPPAPPPPVVPPPPPPAVPSGPSSPQAPPGFGTDAQSWDPSWGFPTAASNAPSRYSGSSNRTQAIQKALNLWGQQVTIDPDMQTGIWPIDQDGSYGPKTAKLAAAFQQWVNLTNAADYLALGMTLTSPLTVDGIIGPQSLPWLAAWWPIP
jgi:hypothetical protein